jgi:hypothetical protein
MVIADIGEIFDFANSFIVYSYKPAKLYKVQLVNDE